MKATIGRIFRAILPGRKARLSRSQLVGMYLNQANSKDSYSSEFLQTRERQNGKYSLNRERQ
ncbi:MAG: hypothetical protein JWN25_1011 [Verrucomicrobiales bacterium]|nr:hypothetical protein [Verrucomicrobiales bacterium]